MYSLIGKSVLIDHLGSNSDLCYITNCVIKRFRCNIKFTLILDRL